MSLIPFVLEKSSRSERMWDLPSRLLEDRIVFVSEEIAPHMAGIVVQQLLFLDSRGDDPVHMYISSPGGVVSSGLSIFDTMKYISASVYTYCLGSAASMGAILLAAGEKGHRYCLPNAEVMIHQPSGGSSGTCSDVQIAAKHMEYIKNKLAKILADDTGQPLDKIMIDIDRDYYMTAEEALEYGLVDEILSKKAITEDE